MRRILMFTLAAVLVLPLLSLAQPGPEGAGRRSPMRMQQRIFEHMKLTDDQRDQIRKLSLEHAKAVTEIDAKIRVARLDLRELFVAEKLDRGAIEKQIEMISGLQQRTKMIQLDHMFAVYKILTPEQQNLWRKHMGRMGERAGPMHHRGGRWMGMLDEHGPPEDQGVGELQPEEPAP